MVGVAVKEVIGYCIVDNQCRVFQNIDTSKSVVLDIMDTNQRILLDHFWPFDVPLEFHISTRSS